MKNGVTDGTRTHDHRDHNPGLYQLSYSHHRVFIWRAWQDYSVRRVPHPSGRPAAVQLLFQTKLSNLFTVQVNQNINEIWQIIFKPIQYVCLYPLYLISTPIFNATWGSTSVLKANFTIGMFWDYSLITLLTTSVLISIIFLFSYLGFKENQKHI